jgi:hypothetical protein
LGFDERPHKRASTGARTVWTCFESASATGTHKYLQLVMTSNALVAGQKLGCIGQRDRCVSYAARFMGVQS